jgi:hypothetical protein
MKIEKKKATIKDVSVQFTAQGCACVPTFKLCRISGISSTKLFKLAIAPMVCWKDGRTLRWAKQLQDIILTIGTKRELSIVCQM